VSKKRKIMWCAAACVRLAQEGGCGVMMYGICQLLVALVHWCLWHMVALFDHLQLQNEVSGS
jgi:hypothetical protein